MCKMIDVMCTFDIDEVSKFLNSYRTRTNIAQGDVESFNIGLFAKDTNIVLSISMYGVNRTKEYSTIGLIDSGSVYKLLAGFDFFICTIKSHKFGKWRNGNLKASVVNPFKIDTDNISIKDNSNKIEIKTTGCYGNESTISNVNIGLGDIENDYYLVDIESTSYIKSL